MPGGNKTARPEETASGSLESGRRTRAAWYAYDFGNTSVEFAIPYYLTPWMVNDLGVSAVAFGIASAVSSWAIGLSGPYIGVSADEKRTRRQWFVASALISAALLAALGLLPHSGTVAVAGVLLAAMIANYFFQLSSLIYNASMTSAAGKANVVSVSSLGMAFSYLGGIIGVGVIQLFVSGRVIPGMDGRGYALIPAAAVFVICTFPSIFAERLWQRRSDMVDIPEGKLHQRMRTLWKRSAHEYRAGWFLAGYFALNSAIMGLTLYLTLHIQALTHLEGMKLWTVLLAVVLSSTAGAGAIAALRPGQRLVRWIIMAALALWAVNALALSLATSLALAVLCACLHGLLSGILVPTVRGAYAAIFPSQYQALAFGLYGAVQRGSQGLGAILLPLAGNAAGSSSATGAGIAAMGVVALIGVPLFARWKPAATPAALPPESPRDTDGDSAATTAAEA